MCVERSSSELQVGIPAFSGEICQKMQEFDHISVQKRSFPTTRELKFLEDVFNPKVMK
jgi:hypothetical protein